MNMTEIHYSQLSHIAVNEPLIATMKQQMQMQMQ